MSWYKMQNTKARQNYTARTSTSRQSPSPRFMPPLQKSPRL